jgi:serine/threonine-protein kinase
VGSGLDAAADAGLVHRDVKPANVFVATRDGGPHACLGDFGLTKATDSQSGITATGKFLGTIGYAAPEQIQGEQVGRATDVYALGVLLYRALAGVLPFPRPRAIAVAMAHLSQPPPRPSESGPGCPQALDDVVARAMAKEPAERYASATDLGRAAVAAAAQAGDPPPWPGLSR